MKRLRLLTAASAAAVVSGALIASVVSPVNAATTSTLSAVRAAVACTGPAWSATAVYTKDMVVTYGGHSYTAKWWTQNEVPGTTGEWGVWVDNGVCGSTPPTTPPPTTTPPTTTPPTTPPPGTAGKKVVGYFAEWGVYGRNYHVKNIETSGAASKLTHILYAFGNTTGGSCSIGDSYADYDRAYTAAESVDGVADTWDAGALRGSFNQLRKL